jgi:Pyruvate/2-oxoacid:ferredoxin oxidoreductase delta subunit
MRLNNQTMNKKTTWVKCEHCLFATRKSLIIQFKGGDMDHWQYCPGCGEEWEEAKIGTTEV